MIPDAPVHVAMSKWPDAPHWEWDAVVLGEDRHGVWLGMAEGTVFSRPGARYDSFGPHVSLVPHATEHGWFAAFYDHHPTVSIYVDITTPVGFWEASDGLRVGGVDLDLDVIRGRTGRIWVDDEDEFAEHRVSLNYPQDLVEQALSSCAAVERAMSDATAPFDGAHRTWLRRLHDRHGSAPSSAP